jgi:hypothetical protein
MNCLEVNRQSQRVAVFSITVIRDRHHTAVHFFSLWIAVQPIARKDLLNGHLSPEPARRVNRLLKFLHTPGRLDVAIIASPFRQWWSMFSVLPRFWFTLTLDGQLAV